MEQHHDNDQPTNSEAEDSGQFSTLSPASKSSKSTVSTRFSSSRYSQSASFIGTSATQDSAKEFSIRQGSDNVCLELDKFLLPISAASGSASLGGGTSTRKFRRDSLLLNRLRFDKLRIHGRDEEVAILEVCFQRVAEGTSRELVLIGGLSGTGKSLLALSLEERLSKDSNSRAIVTYGKFDLYANDEPYAGIADACRELCSSILYQSALSDEDVREMGATIRVDIGFDVLGVMIRMIPELQDIVQPPDVSDEPVDSIQQHQPSQNLGSLESKNRLNHAFRTILRIVGRFVSPIIFVLDDLQWADMDSLALIEVLITDRENTSLMVIGCFRSNEIEGDLSDTIKSIKAHPDLGTSFKLTEIGLKNLCLSDSNQILMDLLAIDDERRTEDLARLCHDRSEGNPLYLVQFVAMLEEKIFLEYNFGLLTWKWDLGTIAEHTAITANVVELMMDKMKTFDVKVTHLLSLAACLGSDFEHGWLQLVWNGYPINSGNNGDDSTILAFEECVNAAIEARFLENFHSSQYRWAHDKLHEAAKTLVPQEDQGSFQYEVGLILIAQLTKEDFEKAIFVVVNLLNKRDLVSLDMESQMQVCELNLRAADTAIGLSAYQTAAKYSTLGISALPANRWDAHFETTLKLYSIGAAANSCLGNYEIMENYCQAVVEQPNVGLLNKVRLQTLLIVRMGNNKRPKEAVNLSLKVLSEMDQKISNNGLVAGVKAAYILNRIAKTRNAPSLEKVLALPLMKDPILNEAMMLMDKMVVFAIYSGQIFLFIVTAKRMIDLTMKHGLSEYSPPAFSFLGLVVTGVLANLEAGAIYAKVALGILDKVDSRASRAKTTYATHALNLCWTRSLRRCGGDPLLDAYKSGMRCGDTETAMMALTFIVVCSFIYGRPLDSIEIDCRSYLPQMRELDRMEALEITQIVFQMILNLTGQSKNTTVLTGEVIDLDDFETRANIPENTTLRVALQHYQTVLYAYFGSHEEGARLAIKKGNDILTGSPGNPLGYHDAFLRGISLFEMARRTRKGKFVRRAVKLQKLIRSWVNKGNPNVQHYAILLDAEMAAMKKKPDEAKKRYEQAINVATRSGFLNDSALANERYGEYLLNDLNDQEGAIFHLTSAKAGYSEWKAYGKVRMLDKKYGQLFQNDSEGACIPDQVIVVTT